MHSQCWLLHAGFKCWVSNISTLHGGHSDGWFRQVHAAPREWRGHPQLHLAPTAALQPLQHLLLSDLWCLVAFHPPRHARDCQVRCWCWVGLRARVCLKPQAWAHQLALKAVLHQQHRSCHHHQSRHHHHHHQLLIRQSWLHIQEQASQQFRSTCAGFVTSTGFT